MGEDNTATVLPQTSRTLGKTTREKRMVKPKNVITAGMRGKTEKGMSMLAAFEADNIGGTGGRITVRSLVGCAISEDIHL